MNTSHLAHRWTCCCVVIVGLVFIPIIGAPAKDKKPEDQASRAAKMVDAIVNRNKAPKEAKWRGDFPSVVALFPENHDWKEEVRARQAVSQLEQDRTEEVWEEMVKRIPDSRYSETATSAMTGDAHIDEVGTICAELAHSRLIGVFWQHLPSGSGGDGRVIWLDVGIGRRYKDLSEWRKQRPDKTLYRLQIEVCEKAIEALEKAERIPQAQKDHTRNKIEAEIVNLKKSREPVHVQGGYRNVFRVRGKYDAELAKRVHEGIRSGKYGDLGLSPK